MSEVTITLDHETAVALSFLLASTIAEVEGPAGELLERAIRDAGQEIAEAVKDEQFERWQELGEPNFEIRLKSHGLGTRLPDREDEAHG